MVLEAFSVSHGKASAYLPVIELLHGYFGIVKGDEPASRREKVAKRIDDLDSSLQTRSPTFTRCLGSRTTSCVWQPWIRNSGGRARSRPLFAFC